MIESHTVTQNAAMPASTPKAIAAPVGVTSTRTMTMHGDPAQTPRMQSPASTIAPRIAGSRGSPSRHASPMLTLLAEHAAPDHDGEQAGQDELDDDREHDDGQHRRQHDREHVEQQVPDLRVRQVLPGRKLSWPTRPRTTSENAVDATP